eukprot:3580024-Alexandrium_andersonii.AAC.1
MWIDETYSPDPGVPMNVNEIENQSAKYYKDPVPFKGSVVIAVDGANEDPLRSKGKLKAVSAEESRFAYLLAIHKDVLAKDKKRLTEWKASVLSVQMTFKVLPNDLDKFKESVNLRERAGDEFSLIGRTSFQR